MTKAANLAALAQGPAFSIYQGSAATALGAATWTKVGFDTKEFDTNNNFASSRFTPTVAGYYQFTANAAMAVSSATLNMSLYKNGSPIKNGTYTGSASWIQATGLIYLNGTTDYVEAYCYSSTAQNTALGSYQTYFQGFLARAA